ncbi:hypothetical protein [Psittacicella gerlachiana]|uniref:Uncharacterized protein n=1 Tax=Psittacicella gerlachiana TaxID=2028574 RepID=A0A3A1Y2R9_9GAMM|nr:hypothetical protein [Psittacicella gerlachiana]RIY32602.1 hypothetical protein CKF59_06855 [Psittacicella gerlachiana]
MVHNNYDLLVKRNLKRLISSVSLHDSENVRTRVFARLEGGFIASDSLRNKWSESLITAKSQIFNKNITNLGIRGSQGSSVEQENFDLVGSQILPDAYVRLHANYLTPLAHEPHQALLDFLEKSLQLPAKLLREQLETHQNELLVQNTLLPSLLKKIAKLQVEISDLEQKFSGYLDQELVASLLENNSFTVYLKEQLNKKYFYQDDHFSISTLAELVATQEELLFKESQAGFESLQFAPIDYRKYLKNDIFSLDFNSLTSFYYVNDLGPLKFQANLSNFYSPNSLFASDYHRLDLIGFIVGNLDLNYANGEAVPEATAYEILKEHVYNTPYENFEQGGIIRYSKPNLFQYNISVLASAFAYRQDYALSPWQQMRPIFEVLNYWFSEEILRSLRTYRASDFKHQMNDFLVNTYALLDSDFNQAYNYLTEYSANNSGDLLFGRSLAYEINTPSFSETKEYRSYFIPMPGHDVNRFNFYLRANLDFDFGYSPDESRVLNEIFTTNRIYLMPREISGLEEVLSKYSIDSFSIHANLNYIYAEAVEGFAQAIYAVNSDENRELSKPKIVNDLEFVSQEQKNKELFDSLYIYKRLGLNSFGAVDWHSNHLHDYTNPLELSYTNIDELKDIYTTYAQDFYNFTGERNRDLIKTYFNSSSVNEALYQKNKEEFIKYEYNKDLNRELYNLTASEILVSGINAYDEMLKIYSNNNLPEIEFFNLKDNQPVPNALFDSLINSHESQFVDLKVRLSQLRNPLFTLQSPESYIFRNRENAILSSKFMGSRIGYYLPVNLAQTTELPYDKLYASLRNIVKRAILIRNDLERLPQALTYKFDPQLLEFTGNELTSKEKLASLNLKLNLHGRDLTSWLVGQNQKYLAEIDINSIYHLQMQVDFFNHLPNVYDSNAYYLVKDQESDKFSIIYLEKNSLNLEKESLQTSIPNYVVSKVFALNHDFDEENYVAMDLERRSKRIATEEDILSSKLACSYQELSSLEQGIAYKLFNQVPGLFETLNKYLEQEDEEVTPSRFSYGVDLNWYVEPLSYTCTRSPNATLVTPTLGYGSYLAKEREDDHLLNLEQLSLDANSFKLSWEEEVIEDLSLAQENVLGFESLDEVLATYQVIGVIKQIALVKGSIEELILNTRSVDNLIFDKYDLTKIGASSFKNYLIEQNFLEKQGEQWTFNLKALITNYVLSC